MSPPVVRRGPTRTPLDDKGNEIVVGSKVQVRSIGYGAALWMTSNVATIVALGRSRAEIAHPNANGTYRVHYCHLRVVEP